MIDKALYCIRSLGLCWHQQLSDVFRSMGFKTSKAEADIWMRENGELYKYIAVYVDDLLLKRELFKNFKILMDSS
jgi:Reverse transcriptase (RNA-dependent DNA polymerase)